MPTVVVCSDEFGPLGRAESQALGIGDLPLVAVPHPLAGNLEDLVTAKAKAIAQEVVAVLNSPAEGVSAAYRDRFTSLTERRLDGGAVCLDESCAIDPALQVRGPYLGLSVGSAVAGSAVVGGAVVGGA